MVAQGLAVAIFVAMFVLIVMDKFGRQYITLGCGELTLIGVFGICMRSILQNLKILIHIWILVVWQFAKQH